MTGRTHDLAAFTALVIAFVYTQDLPTMTWATVIAALSANFIGGLFPDIDQSTSDFWDNFRLGPFISKFIVPILGGHRHFSHSIAGTTLIGYGSYYLLRYLESIILIDFDHWIIWYAFMIGVISHILIDLPTKAGIPLLWPLKLTIGFPPFKFMRITSGKFLEHWIVFPGLLILTGYLLYQNQEKVMHFLQNNIK